MVSNTDITNKLEHPFCVFFLTFQPLCVDLFEASFLIDLAPGRIQLVLNPFIFSIRFPQRLQTTHRKQTTSAPIMSYSKLQLSSFSHFLTVVNCFDRR